MEKTLVYDERKIEIYVLAGLLIVAMLRLGWFIGQVRVESLQMDFSAFYTAGQAANAGLTPYENHVATHPDIWDGIARGQFSRFFYPPLAATFFQPWAGLPYALAKYVWIMFVLLCLFLVLLLSRRKLPTRFSTRQIIITCLAIGLFFPLLPTIERGQIDALTLLLLFGAFNLMDRDKARPVVAGCLIALATLFKLQIVFLLPFLLVRRQWRVVAGFMGGGVALIALSLVFNGPQELRNYAVVHLPRFAAFGSGRELDTPLDEGTFLEALSGVPDGFTVKDGQVYQQSTLAFIENAGLPRLLHSLLNRFGHPAGLSVLSYTVFAVLFGCWLWRERRWIVVINQSYQSPTGVILANQGTLFDWQLMLVIILLSAPLTWAMNTIWLLPLVLVLVSRPAHKPWFWLCLFGFIVVALPDTWLRHIPLSEVKYVVGEGLILIGLFVLPQKIGSPYTGELITGNTFDDGERNQ